MTEQEIAQHEHKKINEEWQYYDYFKPEAKPHKEGKMTKSFKAPVGKPAFPPLDEDQYQAICYAVYDLGTHYSEKFDKSIHQVVLIFELPEERIDIERDGEQKNLPRAISKRYTLSMNEKANLRKDIESWRGKKLTELEAIDFNLLDLLGQNCLIQVMNTEKNGNTYSNIDTIIKLPKGMEKKTAENSLASFVFEIDDEPLENTPTWIKEIIIKSNEWELRFKSEAPEDVDPTYEVAKSDQDDLPF